MRMMRMNYKMEELLPIVAWLTEKYTSKESTSIPYEKARMLMNAVIYCIHERYPDKPDDTDINNYNDNKNGYRTDSIFREEVTNLIQEEKIDARTAYETGYQLILRKVRCAKELYDSFIEDFYAYGNMAYQETIVKGMPAFFLRYDPKFNPQDHLLTLDYPTITPVYPLTGIDAIYQYLQYISLEQEFLHLFPTEAIHSLLTRYSNEYEELIINISSIVLRNAVACLIIGKEITGLRIEADELIILRKFINKQPREILENKLYGYINTLTKYGYHGNQALLHYLIYDIKDFAAELLNASENHCIDVIFAVK
jgi:hypothetical protein